MQIVTQEQTRMARAIRRPQHRFQLRVRPWQIQPCLIAPVLPGETMKQLLLQARVVTDPLQSPLVGFFCEFYFFYCPHRSLPGGADFMDMMIDPTKDLSAYEQTTSPDVDSYTPVGGIKWVEQCLEAVTSNFFRNEGEGWDSFLIDGKPAASINTDSWLDSTMNEGEYDDADIQVIDAATTDVLFASEIEQAMRQWQLLRQQNLTDMTYDDYLRSYGIRAPQVDTDNRPVPELLRYVRDWSYPVNTVDPSDGSPSSAVSWVIAERADKDRFFKEPGFIFGVTVTRPKFYSSKQAGNVAAMMDDAYSWLPAVLANDRSTSIKLVANGQGPLPANTDAQGYYIDIRDLLMYGDQFINFALTETNAALVALPTDALQKRFPDEDMSEDLFIDNTDVSGLTRVRYDGVVSFQIASTVRDMSPTVGSTL